MIDHCPVCGSPGADSVYTVERSPLIIAMPAGRALSAGDYAPLDIVLCEQCGHVYNAAYDSELSERMYTDAFLTNVPVNISMVDSLRRIVEWVGDDVFSRKSVIEIGAGSGHLSRIIAEKADTVTIYEPCQGLAPDMIPETNINVLNQMFAPNTVPDLCDLVICRQVIEHVADPGALIQGIADTLRPGGHAYLEVPSAEYIFERSAVCDLYQAHVQYFSRPHLLYLADRARLVPVRTHELKDGHDFGILFRLEPDTEPKGSPPEKSAVTSFEELAATADGAARTFAGLSGDIGLYGATWQSQGLLSMLPDTSAIVVAFDDNDQLHGAFLHGGGRPIPVAAPDAGRLKDLSAVVIAAYLHDHVIAEKIRSFGFDGNILTLRAGATAGHPSGMTSIFATAA